MSSSSSSSNSAARRKGTNGKTRKNAGKRQVRPEARVNNANTQLTNSYTREQVGNMIEAKFKKMVLAQQTGEFKGAKIPKTGSSALGYLNSLLDPSECKSRIPDSYPGKTATCSSLMYFDVSISVADQGTDTGRFSLLVQPILGHTQDVVHYKVACVDSTGAWPTDFLNPSSYVKASTGRDLRVDPYYETLVGPGPGMFTLENETPPTTISPFGPNPQPVDGTLADWTYLVGATYYNTALGSTVALPLGQWFVTIRTSGGTGGIGTVSATNVDYLQTSIPDIESQVDSYQSGNAWTWIGLVSVTGLGQAIRISQSPTGINRASLYITPTFIPGYPSTSNGGLIQMMRPTAMSVLATCMAPEIQTGGEIASVLLPGEAARDGFFTNSPNAQTGALQLVESVGQITGSYSGPFTKGCYTFWKPETRLDTDLRTPDQCLHHQYPTIIVSGKYVSTSAQPVAAPLRILVVTNYEFRTMSRLFDQESSAGSTALMEELIMLLGAISSTSMPNKTHLSFLEKVRRFITEARGIYNENADWMGPLGRKIGDLVSRLPMM